MYGHRSLYTKHIETKDNQKSIFTVDPKGINVKEEWFCNEEYHRDNGPAVVRRMPFSGLVTHELWYQEGLLHRSGGPAHIIYDHLGAIYEAWYNQGVLHNLYGPAIVSRDCQTRIALKEQWYINGDNNRRDGPALTYRDRKTGKALFELRCPTGP